MAAAFSLAGFEASDVHMSDILAGKISLADYKGLAACGGFHMETFLAPDVDGQIQFFITKN
jgi:phosphoribosylformylglycinamidine (FGAM) synthase-like amidotransferase family enzyme